MPARALALVAIIGLLWPIAVRVTAADSADVLTAPAWDLVRGLGWPSAMVALMFSPVGRALAGLITAITPIGAVEGGAQLSDEVRAIAEVLAEVSESVRRSSQVQEQTVHALAKVERSLAILLDRTSR